MSETLVAAQDQLLYTLSWPRPARSSDQAKPLPETLAALERERLAAGAITRSDAKPPFGWLIAAFLLWLVFYVPLAYLWIAGWRPPSAWLRQFLLALFGVHSTALLLGWGILWLGQSWTRHSQWRRFAASRSLEHLLTLSPSEFERWTATLLEGYGYQVRNMPDTSDHGIDLIVTSPAGEIGVVQCKRYRGTVGEPVVRDLYGTVVHVGAVRGFLVTTGAISRSARAWAGGKPLELIDGETLIQLLK